MTDTTSVCVSVCDCVYSYLQVSVDDAVLMQVRHGLQDLFDHQTGVFFSVNTSIQNTIKQLSTRDPLHNTNTHNLIHATQHLCVL